MTWLLAGVGLVILAALSFVAQNGWDRLGVALEDESLSASPAWRTLDAQWGQYSLLKQARFCNEFRSDRETAWATWRRENYTRPVEYYHFHEFLGDKCPT